MIKFESDNIIVGFIKNLLMTFKLPTPKLYTYNDDKYAVDGQLYIKDDYICQYKNGKFINLFRFDINNIPENYYKTLKFTSINYDTHTHEYLGEYLRFIRDYKGLNLMSLYNCYSNNFPKQVAIKIENESGQDSDITQDDYTLYVDPKDTNYKVIMLPIKVNQKYTIAVDCPTKYQIFSGFYGRSFSVLEKGFWRSTLVTVGSSRFSRPFIYDKVSYENLSNNNMYDMAVNKEEDLKLFIKLPATNNSSIVILEGDYTDNNDWVYETSDNGKETNIFKALYNYSVLNFEPDFEDYEEENKNIPEVKYDDLIISNLQLLKLNTNYSYPFSDRLIEYLTDNVINPIDTISDNIKRLQWLLLDKYLDGKKSTGISSIGNTYGLWDDKYVAILYKLAVEEGLINEKSDLLGYVDKDIEAKIGKYVNIQEKEGN